MNGLKSRTVPIGAGAGERDDVRVWEKGRGTPIVVLSGFGGLTRWPDFLERLSTTRRVVAPSLPGFPGSGRAHETLDTHMDWLIAVHDLVAAAGTKPVDLVGISLGAALAADVAALWPDLVRRLVLVSPLGLHDTEDPPLDIFAQPPGGMDAALTADPATFKRHMAKPEGADELEWQIVALRANEAAARILWPLGDTGVAKRMRRIVAPTLIVAGDADRILPRSTARKFARGVGGKSAIKVVPGAGHLVDLDAPDALAKLVLAHCGAAVTVKSGRAIKARPAAKKRRTPAPKRPAARQRAAAKKRR